MDSIVIRGTGKYIPNNKIYNDFFIKHFDKLGLPSAGLMEHLGRRKRYLASSGETSVTMACEAGRDALQKLQMSAEELDMIVFVSDTPEYLTPTNSMKLADLLGADHVKRVFDFNANCSGMLLAMDVVEGFMKTRSDVKKCIVIGSFNISAVARKDDTVVYPNFGDAAAAIVLEKVTEQDELGFLDFESFVDASYQQYITYPKCGLSKVALDEVESKQKKMEWIPFDMSFIPGKWTEMIQAVLHRHDLEPNDIDYYVFSQLSDPDNIKTMENLGIDDSKYLFVGREYGYTGNTCTILVLDRMWNYISKPGNRVVFCTVGGGYSTIVILYKF